MGELRRISLWQKNEGGSLKELVKSFSNIPGFSTNNEDFLSTSFDPVMYLSKMMTRYCTSLRWHWLS